MWDGLTGRTRGMQVAVWLLVGLLACLVPTMAIGRPLTVFDLTVVGVGLEVGPPTQQVPKGVTSTVTTTLTVPQASIPIASLQKLLPQNLTG